jgi:hypothetical protein
LLEAAMPSTAEVARDYTTMLLAGQFGAAGDRFWAADVKSVEPLGLPRVSPATTNGVAARRAKNKSWLSASRIDDLSIDGPFVTGDQFALFLDMVITDRSTGTGQPFSEIALYTVERGQIIEERYFYD